jgi:methyl-accepting chemotaxis protein
MIVLLLLVTYFISNNITTSILNVASSLNDMASSKADLTRRIKAEGDDEVGLLVMAFNNFVAVMERLIGKTVLVSGEVTSQAESIHVIAIETHKGIVTQQQEIDLVAAAVAELSASSSEVATNASSTTALTKNATEETTKSHSITKENREAISSLVEEVARAAEVINHLQEKTNEIGSVIDVIRGIADQTNLLALNAAIEAARAGEQGRGFAVVADEVRSLANNTQVSTGEIEVLIRALQADSLEAVNVMKNGSKQALASVEQSKLVEQALDSISHFSAEINERSIQMLTASEEQMQVSEKLSQSINHINDVAIKTVDKANETIQSSKQLHRVADELGESVTQFLVGESSGN